MKIYGLAKKNKKFVKISYHSKILMRRKLMESLSNWISKKLTKCSLKFLGSAIPNCTTGSFLKSH